MTYTGKKWATNYPRLASGKRKHPSKAATYRYVRRAADRWHQEGALRSQHLNVYVDERDGHGWQLYERIDLNEIPRSVTA